MQLMQLIYLLGRGISWLSHKESYCSKDCGKPVSLAGHWRIPIILHHLQKPYFPGQRSWISRELPWWIYKEIQSVKIYDNKLRFQVEDWFPYGLNRSCSHFSWHSSEKYSIGYVKYVNDIYEIMNELFACNSIWVRFWNFLADE